MPAKDAPGLASSFVDGCTTDWAKAEIERGYWEQQEQAAPKYQRHEPRKKKNNANNLKNKARRCYMKHAGDTTTLALPLELGLERCFDDLPDPSWIGLEVCFRLQTPWYSKDDRPFHVLDNPVRKDRVFGVPFISAASWKGLLRWACRMQAGLQQHLHEHEGKLGVWKDPAWILHLFGNEKDESEHFRRGALAFYPTWFSKIDFEVINPHSRAKRAGIQPIYYEVVPADTDGVLRLLYAPLPGQADHDTVASAEALGLLLDAITVLLVDYGISAKRTVGWGTAGPEQWRAFRADMPLVCEASASAFKTKLLQALSPAETPRG